MALCVLLAVVDLAVVDLVELVAYVDLAVVALLSEVLIVLSEDCVDSVAASFVPTRYVGAIAIYVDSLNTFFDFCFPLIFTIFHRRAV